MIYSFKYKLIVITVTILIFILNCINCDFTNSNNNINSNNNNKESIKLKSNNGDKTIIGYSLTNDFNFYNNSIIDNNSTNGINWESIDILIIPPTLSRIKEIISIASSHNVKVCLMYSFLDIQILNGSGGSSGLKSLNRSVFEIVQKVDRFGADGISLFFKFPVDEFYLLKISTLYHVLKGINSNYQLSVSIPVKVGYYKLNEISKYCDLIIANSYDMGNFNNGQMAIPNSPGYSIRQEIFKKWITKFGIPKNKIVLGLGWYGYKYNCTSNSTLNIFSNDCIINSNNNGNGVSKIMYKDIYKYTLGKQDTSSPTNDQYELTSMELWDTSSRTPYLNFRTNGINYFQIRYDNPRSIFYKLAETGIGGVAIWRIDQIVNLPLIEIKNMYNSINRINIGNEFNQNFEFW